MSLLDKKAMLENVVESGKWPELEKALLEYHKELDRIKHQVPRTAYTEYKKIYWKYERLNNLYQMTR